MSARVLIVDGDRFYSRTLRAQLQSLGVGCSHALTGAEAIDFAYEHHPELLLIDLSLELGLDGPSTAASIRARVDAAEIFLARRETPEALRRRALDAGGYLLEKPFGTDHLLAAILATRPAILPGARGSAAGTPMSSGARGS